MATPIERLVVDPVTSVFEWAESLYHAVLWRWKQPPEGRIDLQYPLNTELRIAVFGFSVRPQPGVRNFAATELKELENFQPQALAAPLLELRRIGAARRSGEVMLKNLTHPLLVFSTPETGLLREEDREDLWNLFELPVYEQLRTGGGELIAQSCEAQEGLHLEPGTGAPQGLEWKLADNSCACGRGRLLSRAATAGD